MDMCEVPWGLATYVMGSGFVLQDSLSDGWMQGSEMGQVFHSDLEVCPW